MQLKHTKKGFTLVELLIATGIFAVFMTSITTLLVDVYRASRRITLEYQIYQDMRIMVKQVSDLLENNTIDYEEYYRKAIGGTYFTKSKPSDLYTYTYGDYGKLFYDFGSDLNPGARCNNGTPANSTCVIDKTTIDRNMGKNPTLATFGDPESATAFCGANPPYDYPCTPDPTVFNRQTQLYLINANGDRKTILALEPITKTIGTDTYAEKVLSQVWFNGLDTDSDDIPDDWKIGDEFNNVSGDLGLADLVADLAATKSESLMYKDFSPISPVRTNILDMKFYVSPLEDPYKAFAETDPALGTLTQPHITLIMTVEPSASELVNYLGPIPRQTIQTTIYSKVNKEVRSY